MNINRCLFFYLILIFSCRDKPSFLIGDNSPYPIEYVEYEDKKRMEFKCDSNNLLISQKVITDDSTQLFEFIKFDTISEMLSNKDFEERTYIKTHYSKIVFKNNKIVFEGMATEIDSIKMCVCGNNCK
ncbi:MAG TPA: hypothetical protein VK169_13350 [Saprospiraceae bacterium]|nr:hypothetical protein [Saprospiraceae bacterium]